MFVFVVCVVCVGGVMHCVYIVAGIRLYREGLALLLSNRPEFTVTGTARCRGDALAQLARSLPDVVLVDLTTEDSATIIRDIKRVAPSLPIVAMAVNDAEEQVMSCIEAGVAGFVSRDGSLDDLAAAVCSAALGELQCTPKLAGSLLRRVALLASARPAPCTQDRLTGREWQIVRLIERNLSNKEIASHLGIEVATVKNHVHNLLDKLHLRKRSEVARWSLFTETASDTNQH
jgi:DNA-binding NarL/FixJ family response regulator